MRYSQILDNKSLIREVKMMKSYLNLRKYGKI
jgi:hypothetical protein